MPSSRRRWARASPREMLAEQAWPGRDARPGRPRVPRLRPVAGQAAGTGERPPLAGRRDSPCPSWRRCPTDRTCRGWRSRPSRPPQHGRSGSPCESSSTPSTTATPPRGALPPGHHPDQRLGRRPPPSWPGSTPSGGSSRPPSMRSKSPARRQGGAALEVSRRRGTRSLGLPPGALGHPRPHAHRGPRRLHRPGPGRSCAPSGWPAAPSPHRRHFP